MLFWWFANIADVSFCRNYESDFLSVSQNEFKMIHKLVMFAQYAILSSRGTYE